MPIGTLTAVESPAGPAMAWEELRPVPDFQYRFYGRAAREAPPDPGRPVLALRQVHGAGVFLLEPDVPLPDAPPEADAVVTARRDVATVIRVADCCPVLVVDPAGRAYAHVHAGWRGVVQGVVPRALACLGEEFPLAPEQLQVYVGPAICAGCYEVGEDVAAAFRDRFGDGAGLLRPAAPGKWWLDLPAAIVRQATAAGVPARRCWTSPDCTACRAERYHSYRRERRAGAAGRGRNHSLAWWTG